MDNTTNPTPQPKGKTKEQLLELPDFFIREVDTGGSEALSDINAYDKNADRYVLHSKDTYKSSEKFMRELQEKGIDFDTAYDEIAKKYKDFKSLNFDTTALSRPPVFDNPMAKLAGLDTVETDRVIRKAKLHETDILDWLTPKEVAQQMGVKNEDGFFDSTVDDSAFKNFFGKNTYKVASERDEAGEFKFKTTDDGMFYLEKVDPKEELHSADQIVTGWNSGIFKNTFMDGNKVDESVLSTAMRKSPQLAAGALLAAGVLTGGGALVATALASLPFMMDTVSGGLELYKTFTGTSTKPSVANHMQNFLNRFDFDRTQDELANPFHLKAIVSGTADIIGQLGGMTTIAKGGIKGMETLSKSLMGSGAGTVAHKTGNTLSHLSMAISQSAELPKLAREMGIEDSRELQALHLGYIGSLMMVNRLSNRIFNPMEKKVEEAAGRKVVRDMMENMTPAQFRKIVEEPVKQAAFIRGAVSATKKLSKKMMEEYAEGTGTATTKFAVNALTEGTEEVLEVAFEELVKGAHNFVYDERKAGKGRFEDFNPSEFARDAGTSFLYGALAGGVFGTRLGKKAIGIKVEEDNTLMDLLIRDGGRKEIRDAVEMELERFSDTHSYSVDKDGYYEQVDPQAIDPSKRLSQRDVQRQVLENKIRYMEDTLDYSIGTMVPGGDWRAAIAEQFRDKIHPQATDIGKEIRQTVLQNIEARKENERDEAKLQDSDDAEQIKLKIDQRNEEIQQREQLLRDIVAGKRTAHYIQKAFYDHIQDPKLKKYDELVRLGEDLRANYTASVQHYEKEQVLADERSKKVLEATDPEVFKAMIADGPLNDAAKKRITDYYESGEQLRGFYQEAKAGIRAGLEALAKKDPRIDPNDFDAIEEEISENLDNAFDVEHIRDAGSETVYDGTDTPVLNIHTILPELAKKISTAGITKADIDRMNKASIRPHSVVEDLYKLPDSGLNIINEYKNHSAQPAGEHLKGFLERLQARINHIEDLIALTPASLAFDLSETAGAFIPDVLEGDVKNIFQEWVDQGRDKTILPAIKELLEAAVREFYTSKFFTTNYVEDSNGIRQYTSFNLREIYEEIEEKYTKWKKESSDPVKEAQIKFAAKIDNDLDRLQTSLLSSLRTMNGYDEVQKMAIQAETLLIETKGEKGFNKKMEKYMEFFRVMHKILNSPMDTVKIAEEIYNKDTAGLHRENLSLIRLYERVNPDDFYKRLMEVIEPGKSAPTWEQIMIVAEMYGFLAKPADHKWDPLSEVLLNKIRLHKVILQGRTQKYMTALYPNMLYVGGSAGSGKTTYISGNNLDMVQKMLQEQGSAHVGILSMAANHRQHSKLLKLFKDRGLKVSNTGDSFISVDDLIKKIQSNDPEISSSNVIAFDEATFIQGFKFKKDRGSLEELSEAIKAYNKTFRSSPGDVPLNMLLLGDSSQGGSYSMDTTGAVIDNNINKAAYLERTTYATTSQRSGFHSIDALKKEIDKYMSAGTMILSNRLVLDTSHGTYEGKPAGAEIVSTLEEKHRAVKEMLATGQEVLYITDRIATDPEYMNMIKAFPELANSTYHPEQVQGAEAPYVIVDLKDTSVAKDGRRELVNMRTMGMAVSRAEQKVVLVKNSQDRDWKSTGNRLQERFASNITPDKYDAMKESVLGTLASMLGVDAPAPAVQGQQNSGTDTPPTATEEEQDGDIGTEEPPAGDQGQQDQEEDPEKQDPPAERKNALTEEGGHVTKDTKPTEKELSELEKMVNNRELSLQVNLGRGFVSFWHRTQRKFLTFNKNGKEVTRYDAVIVKARQVAGQRNLANVWWNELLSDRDKEDVLDLYEKFAIVEEEYRAADSHFLPLNVAVARRIAGVKFRKGGFVKDLTDVALNHWFTDKGDPNAPDIDNLLNDGGIMEGIEAEVGNITQTELHTALVEVMQKYPKGITKKQVKSLLEDHDPRYDLIQVEYEFINRFGLDLRTTHSKLYDIITKELSKRYGFYEDEDGQSEGDGMGQGSQENRGADTSRYGIPTGAFKTYAEQTGAYDKFLNGREPSEELMQEFYNKSSELMDHLMEIAEDQDVYHSLRNELNKPEYSFFVGSRGSKYMSPTELAAEFIIYGSNLPDEMRAAAFRDGEGPVRERVDEMIERGDDDKDILDAIGTLYGFGFTNEYVRTMEEVSRYLESRPKKSASQEVLEKEVITYITSTLDTRGKIDMTNTPAAVLEALNNKDFSKLNAARFFVKDGHIHVNYNGLEGRFAELQDPFGNDVPDGTDISDPVKLSLVSMENSNSKPDFFTGKEADGSNTRVDKFREKLNNWGIYATEKVYIYKNADKTKNGKAFIVTSYEKGAIEAFEKSLRQHSQVPQDILDRVTFVDLPYLGLSATEMMDRLKAIYRANSGKVSKKDLQVFLNGPEGNVPLIDVIKPGESNKDIYVDKNTTVSRLKHLEQNVHKRTLTPLERLAMTLAALDGRLTRNGQFVRGKDGNNVYWAPNLTRFKEIVLSATPDNLHTMVGPMIEAYDKMSQKEKSTLHEWTAAGSDRSKILPYGIFISPIEDNAVKTGGKNVGLVNTQYLSAYESQYFDINEYLYTNAIAPIPVAVPFSLEYKQKVVNKIKVASSLNNTNNVINNAPAGKAAASVEASMKEKGANHLRKLLTRDKSVDPSTIEVHVEKFNEMADNFFDDSMIDYDDAVVLKVLEVIDNDSILSTIQQTIQQNCAI